MEKNKNAACGAVIERGIVTAKNTTQYDIRSLDRPGIEVWDIEAINPLDDFDEGDMVFFFAFEDGTGRIVCGA